MLRVVADSAIPGLADLSKHVDLIRIPGEEINASCLSQADALLVRSVTPVNASLLTEARRLKFVASATIGCDHVDLNALQERGIEFAHAPGCNANAVVDYVLASIKHLVPDVPLSALRVGIVGYGNVGSRLYQALSRLSCHCHVYDPFVTAPAAESSMRAIFNCDVVSIHVPLTRVGSEPTLGMVTPALLDQSRQNGQLSKRVLINTSRGLVLEKGLINRVESEWQMVNDVWVDEPTVDLESLRSSAIATPHIAGHSLAGKLRGTEMILAALLKRFPELEIAGLAKDPLVRREMLVKNDQVADTDSFWLELEARVAIASTSEKFQTVMAMCRSRKARAEAFGRLRKKAQRPMEFDYSANC